MIRSAIESPAAGNDFIYSYIPNSDRMVLGHGQGESLFRYTFSCDSSWELEELVSELIPSVTESLNLPCLILTGWRIDSPVLTPARRRLLEHAYRKQGFAIESQGDYRIAISEAIIELDDFKLKEFLIGRSYIAWGAVGDLTNRSLKKSYFL